MKKIFLIIFLITISISCEDPVDVDVPNGTPNLVIDASLEFTKRDDGSLDLDEDRIRLTMSAPFFDLSVPTVSNATVFITNLTRDLILNFEESSFEPGTYRTFEGSSSWNFDDEYELTVIYDNQTYKATTKLIPTVPIDSVKQGTKTLFDDDDTEVIIAFTDNGERDDYYLFDFDFSLFLTSEDRFYQGQEFEFSYFYEDVALTQDVTIKILGIDQEYFEYVSLLIDQSEQEGGNPFLAPPAVLRGNITNTSNEKNPPFGYFNLSEVDRINFTIQK